MLFMPGHFLAPSVVAGLLLDSISATTMAAYSVRKLRAAYAGPGLRVRRSSDNTEQDIGFVSGVLDAASLLTFCGSGNGFVSKWYDQGASTNHATRTVASMQPYIVVSGAVQTTNSLGQPCLSSYVNGSSQLSLFVSTTGASGSSTAVVALTTAAQGGWGSFGGGGEVYTPFGGPTADCYDNYCSPNRPNYGPYGVAGVHTSQHSGSLVTIFNGGVQVGSSQSSSFTQGSSDNRLFGGIAKTSIQEVIFTTTVASTADRRLIERSMGAYFGVTVA